MEQNKTFNVKCALSYWEIDRELLSRLCVNYFTFVATASLTDALFRISNDHGLWFYMTDNHSSDLRLSFVERKRNNCRVLVEFIEANLRAGSVALTARDLFSIPKLSTEIKFRTV